MTYLTLLFNALPKSISVSTISTDFIHIPEVFSTHTEIQLRFSTLSNIRICIFIPISI